MRTAKFSLEITYDETLHDHPRAWDWAELLDMPSQDEGWNVEGEHFSITEEWPD